MTPRDTVSPLALARGLEAIIDAAAGVLAEHSLAATLDEMARALDGIVPFTSLAIYEAPDGSDELVPVFAVGRWVEETLADRPPLVGSIVGSVVRLRQTAHIESDAKLPPEYTIPGTSDDEPYAMVSVPLVAGEKVIGALTVWREDVSPTFAVAEAELIGRFATLAALAYANARQREQLRELALTDDLTGLSNRRFFHDRLAGELARAAREGAPLTLILLDLDDFKAINDGFGHPAGDATLRAFSAVLRSEIRAGDIVCRTGGEEFAVILPGADGEEGPACALRILSAVRAAGLGPRRSLTACAGVAVSPHDAGTVAELFSIADERLLAAKVHGKDRAVSG
jgi:diguanylate cyclase (GGDEF)-like protein